MFGETKGEKEGREGGGRAEGRKEGRKADRQRQADRRLRRPGGRDLSLSAPATRGGGSGQGEEARVTTRS